MALDIELMNMDFGESVLCTDETNIQCLLIDCGSLNIESKDTTLKCIKTKISKYLVNAMLSHYHEDHINGLMELIETHHVTFDTLLIPNIFTDCPCPNHIDIELLRYIIEKEYKEIKIGQKIINLIGGTRQLVLVDDSFKCSYDQYNVSILWPPIDKNLHQNSIRYLKKIIDRYNIESEINKIHAISKEISNVIIHSATPEKKPTRDIIKNQKTQIPENYKTILIGIDTKLCKIKEQIDIKMESANKKEKNLLLRRLTNYGNEISIVCTIINDKKYLFTGDITSSLFKKILSKNLSLTDGSERFDFVKVPHHGTKNYYTELFPKLSFDTLGISNGDNKKKERWPISEKYCELINSKGSKIICTNTDEECCEYYKNNNVPCCKECNIVKENQNTIRPENNS